VGDVCRVDGGEDSNIWSIRVGVSSGRVELTNSDGEDTCLGGVDGDDMGEKSDGDIQSTGETSRFRSSSSSLSSSSSHLLFAGV
jgi:hypothetical protein